MNEQESTHTPGPWEFTEAPFEDGEGYIIEDAKGHYIGAAPIEADARLMAASTAMLKALEAEQAANALDSTGRAYDMPWAEYSQAFRDADDLIRAAIAQARGQEVAS